MKYILKFLIKQTVSNPGSAELRKVIAEAASSATMKPASQAGGKYYVVQSGDTLYKISKEHGVSVDELRRLNKLGKDDNIYPGQKLLVSQ